MRGLPIWPVLSLILLSFPSMQFIIGEEIFLKWLVDEDNSIKPISVAQPVITINGKFPGPLLTATTNDNIHVNVFNDMDKYPVLITWLTISNILISMDLASLLSGKYKNGSFSWVQYSFANLSETWAKDIKFYSTNRDCIKMLVGNKVDRETERAVTREEGLAFAKEHNCLFLECSAWTRENVQLCFKDLTLKVLKAVDAYCRSYIWSGTNTITKKALVAWDRVCLPKTAGSLINIYLWNKAALVKTCWDLASKQDKLWIRWVHAFYIKDQDFFTAPIPKQASWMIRKLLDTRTSLQQLQIDSTKPKNTIRQSYLQLIGDRPRVPWKCMMFQNASRPKPQFTMWLMIQGRLLTSDRLTNWGMDVNQKCVFCEVHNESRDHLFMQCPYSQLVWHKVVDYIGQPQFISTN